MKKINYSTINLQKKLISINPDALIVNPNFPKFELIKDKNIYGFKVSNDKNESENYAKLYYSIGRAYEEMIREYKYKLSYRGNSLGSQKANLLNDELTTKLKNYQYYTSFDIDLGIEVQITDFIEYKDEDGIQEEARTIWVTEKNSDGNRFIALKYLTNFGFTLDEAKEFIAVFSRVCKCEMSLIYEGKPLYTFNNGVEA